MHWKMNRSVCRNIRFKKAAASLFEAAFKEEKAADEKLTEVADSAAIIE